MIVMLSLALADSGDTGVGDCSAYSERVEADFDEGVCVGAGAPDLCAMFPSACPLWSDFEARAIDNPSVELVDCGPGSDIAHRGTYTTTESGVVLDFGVDGVLVGAESWQGFGFGWCCEGRQAFRLKEGVTGGSCLPDVEEPVKKEAVCGCMSQPGHPGAVVFAGLLLAAIRRGTRR